VIHELVYSTQNNTRFYKIYSELLKTRDWKGGIQEGSDPGRWNLSNHLFYSALRNLNIPLDHCQAWPRFPKWPVEGRYDRPKAACSTNVFTPELRLWSHKLLERGGSDREIAEFWPRGLFSALRLDLPCRFRSVWAWVTVMRVSVALEVGQSQRGRCVT